MTDILILLGRCSNPVDNNWLQWAGECCFLDYRTAFRDLPKRLQRDFKHRRFGWGALKCSHMNWYCIDFGKNKLFSHGKLSMGFLIKESMIIDWLTEVEARNG